MTVRRAAIPAFAALGAAWMAAAGAHAFPEHEDPGVGAVLHQAPKQVSIRFDGPLEPAFSRLTVKDASGRELQVKSHVGDASRQTLQAPLPPLSPGKYHVYWKVVSIDGHRTDGDYFFTLQP